MIDFGRLKRQYAQDVNDVPNSFVGIRGDVFCVPLGVPLEVKGDEQEENRRLFLDLFRTLRKYTRKLRKYGRWKDQQVADRDGAGNAANQETFGIETEDGEEKLVYTRLLGLDDVLDVYDDLTLFGLRARMRSSDEIDFSQVHREMERAVYLPNDMIHFDAMNRPGECLEAFDTDLVQLYCFVYEDVRRALGWEESLRPEVRAEAERLREAALWPGASLFGSAWKETLSALREVFERIDQFTAYRDEAFWSYHDAVRQLLYPNRQEQDGIYWGINNFCFVWEDMCHERLRMADPNGILYADAPGWSKDQGTFSRHVDVGAYLKISHPDGRSSIPLRPDVVVLPRTLYLVDNKKESDNYNNYEWSESTWDDFGLKISHVLKKLPVRACLLSTLQVATSMLPSTPRDATVQEKTKASEKINEAYEGTHEALSKGNFSDVLIVFDWFSENAEELAIRRALGDLFMFADTGLHSVLPSSEDFHPEIAESFFRNRYYVTGFPEGIKGFYTMLLYENGVVILDFKYDSYTGVNAEGEKPERDRRKQWAYALALQSMKLGGDGCRVRRNVYVIPGEPAEDTSDGKEDGIEILKWNIGDVMRDYGRSEYVG